MLKPLEEQGLFDSINVSTGAVTADGKIIPYEGYQIPFCRELKQYMKVPCIGGGLLTDAKMANMIVRNGAADAVYIGREILMYYHLYILWEQIQVSLIYLIL